ncbi:hypothetical protein [Lysinibacillus odysseyi]|uniref:Uncharacterized protein n=1 Tax=Lysinibacillus odysseyi 34hs-1 = NBRC 100172 TaxID=1220589 RepID=A0A0A3JEA4_9BACI|nr:hypothetical protein [Lysinibacillus odysseyi]KGR85352.1 hypothetical protein CD32_08930 [Lysinibacillus odysseyi 34hs-1 = NBRC 100172]
MKRIIRALLISLLLHFLYAVALLGRGYIKTLLYVPDFSKANGKFLQDELVFGTIFPLWASLASIIVVAVVTWLILKLASIKKAAV